MIKLLRLIVRWLSRIWRGAASADGAHFEVERKFNLTEAEIQALPAKLTSLGYAFDGVAEMVDTFVPAAVTGDMIRVRDETISGASHTVLTIKTWTTVAGQRERKETEESLTPFVRARFLELGERLKGKKLSTFTKTRDLYTSTVDNHKVTVGLDRVSGLGKYSGPYLEIEVIVKVESEVEAARAFIVKFAKQLLGEDREFVQMSYQQMLMETESLS